MTTDELRAMLLGGDIQTPFVIHTFSGRSYPVEDAASIWSPPGFPGAVVVAVPRRSIAILRLDAIAEVTCEEVEVAASQK